MRALSAGHYVFNGHRPDQSTGESTPTSSSKITAHFATQTWQMISPASLVTTLTSRLWRPQNEQTTSLNCSGASGTDPS
jgi:hypothetical protein